VPELGLCCGFPLRRLRADHTIVGEASAGRVAGGSALDWRHRWRLIGVLLPLLLSAGLQGRAAPLAGIADPAE